MKNIFYTKRLEEKQPKICLKLKIRYLKNLPRSLFINNYIYIELKVYSNQFIETL